MQSTSFNLDEITKEYIKSQSIAQKGRHGAMKDGLFQIVADHENFQHEIRKLKTRVEEQNRIIAELTYFKDKIEGFLERGVFKVHLDRMIKKEREWLSKV